MVCRFFLLPGPLAQLMLSQIPDQKKDPLYCSDFITSKTCLAPRWGKILKHNICVVQMQCSLFSCVTKANLVSDSAPAAHSPRPEPGSPSHVGPAHMQGLLPAEYFKHQPCRWKATGPAPGTTPATPFPRRDENNLFLEHSVSVHHGVLHGLQRERLLTPPSSYLCDTFSASWWSDWKNLKLSCRGANDANSKVIPSISGYGPSMVLPMPSTT